VLKSDIENAEKAKNKTTAEIVDEYTNAIDYGLVEFVEDALNGDKNNAYKKNYAVGNVSENEAVRISKLIGIQITTDFIHNLNGDHARHIDNGHGKFGKTDHSMADIKDIGRIGYVLEHYDNIELSSEKNYQYKNKDNSPSCKVIYKKRVNGTYYVVESIPDTKAKTLRIITAYKKD